MAKHGKRYKQAAAKVERGKEYSLTEAIDIVKSVSSTKFDATLEAHFKIKYKTMQNIRGGVQLPNGTGKQVKVLVFAKGEQAKAAKAAGADYVGDAHLIEKIQGGWVDFHFVVSTPDMMKDVGKLGPVLGKKGLMPKPKAGTVTPSVEPIVKQLKAGRVEYRADKSGVVHLGVGKVSFEASQLVENVKVAFDTILKDRPSDAKGEYITSFYIAGTMTPGVKINIKELRK